MDSAGAARSPRKSVPSIVTVALSVTAMVESITEPPEIETLDDPLTIIRSQKAKRRPHVEERGAVEPGGVEAAVEYAGGAVICLRLRGGRRREFVATDGAAGSILADPPAWSQRFCSIERSHTR